MSVMKQESCPILLLLCIRSWLFFTCMYSRSFIKPDKYMQQRGRKRCTKYKFSLICSCCQMTILPLYQSHCSQFKFLCTSPIAVEKSQL
ncbi:hypothetical protein XELAEV_18007866mg [Xenopus laevis]|uniref:Uncharacterized protein n=1 Tax=Xenopus laevis TaxID=8355 RepID=A0A974E2I2_XENLA|nr:hypothetical protein XELAEV_18007866mg [Xenopus laevis]